ncbi:MAG: hypothetical protein LWY06_06870 [Firmicutes bacterium]|nr:hypothetical protein [Bacillota bacterium]
MSAAGTIKIAVMVLLLTILGTVSGFPREKGPSPTLPVIDLSTMNEKQIADIGNKLTSGGAFVVKVPSNYRMTVKVSVKGEAVATDKEKDQTVTLIFSKPLFFYASGKSAPLISLDGKNWDYASKIFGGTLSLGLAMEKDSPEQQPMVNLNMDLDVRK